MGRARTEVRRQPRQERSRALVDAVLAAAGEILVQEGYDGASTKLIAERAGVSVGSLYQYFPTKESIVAALVERYVRAEAEAIRSRFQEVAQLPLDEALRALVRAFVDHHRNETALHKVLIEELPRVDRLAYLNDAVGQVRGALEQLLAARKAELRPENLALAAYVIVHAVTAVTHAAACERPELLADAAFVDELGALVIRYLQRPASRGAAW